MTRVNLLAAILVVLAPLALALEGEPLDSAMVHMDGAGDALRYVPDRIVVTPGALVQLMIFGRDHGRYSLTLDDTRAFDADVDTSGAGIVHVAEFAAPMTPGEYPFHDKHHASAKGVLTVRAQTPSVGVGNGYDTRFYPDRIEVLAGERLVFRNNASEIIHTMTATDGSFDADAVRAGETRTFTAPTKPGEYAFVCKYHADSGMSGTLVVLPARASPAAAPTTESAARADTPATALILVAAAIGLAALAAGRR